MMTVTTWRSLLEKEQRIRGDETPIISLEWVQEESSLDEKIDTHWGDTLSPGEPFVAWSEERVYFSMFYDSASIEVLSLPRNPSKDVQKIEAG